MTVRLSAVFAIIWIGWVISWLAASFWTARTEKRIATWDVWVSRAALLLGALLLWHSARHLPGALRLWRVGFDGGYALAALPLAGILFAWWARLHLGRLWSSSITRKEDHRVVDSGPYRLVRHPIYTGLIAALAATAAASATMTALLGAALIAFGLWFKARIEERFLTAELGAEAYGAYRRRVPMLVPFLPGG